MKLIRIKRKSRTDQKGKYSKQIEHKRKYKNITQ